MIYQSLTAAVLLIAGATAYGCGGADRISDVDYFKGLEDADVLTGQRLETLNRALEDADLDARKAALPRLIDVIDELIAALDKLEPPDDAKRAHADLASALLVFRGEYARAFEERARARSVEELFAFVDEPAFLAASEQFTRACLELDEIGRSKGILISLDCEDDQTSITVVAGLPRHTSNLHRVPAGSGGI
ncbi:MAG: hypothetical protein WEC75_09020 [Dehalococcoidia bacterium]